MGMASLLYLVGLSYFGAIPIPLTLIPSSSWRASTRFPLLAVPMFILAGELMTRGGVTLRLVNFSAVLVGHIKGGLAQVSVLANVIMAGMSGSAAADLAATGSLLIPGMVKRGYPADFAAAVIASASTIGPVIPPSIPMVIIGSMVSVSVGQLFMGGVVPGFIMGLAMMIVVYRYAHRAKLPVERRATRGEFFHALWDGALALAMPAIVLDRSCSGSRPPRRRPWSQWSMRSSSACSSIGKSSGPTCRRSSPTSGSRRRR
jgi:C4-dicarboxylate transporter DctM subunit